MISKTAEYALRTVACLASAPAGIVLADELATRTQVPRRYLNTVLQDLGRAGIVKSKSGPGGGHSLLVDPKELSILDVINAVSPLERIRQCPLGLPSHTELCPLHAELDKAYAHTEKAFAGVTLGQVLASTKGVIPLCDLPISPEVKP
ncbi:RrF2 family transcriptional regulator [Planctopirus hydrillae]|uniref:Rrf2 family transcriptional regulator n=1 Tax=Planctopirus hydrillae TaxID=1841610 RepID=A0A1C3EJD5_9PLAN|nr:Rrf2 family transcriptional regulator [Planctopirus hydrillae]ODA33334.1 Rrf2 family transcriptional regulator [Planctopirus hydrillae]